MIENILENLDVKHLLRITSVDGRCFCRFGELWLTNRFMCFSEVSACCLGELCSL